MKLTQFSLLVAASQLAFYTVEPAVGSSERTFLRRVQEAESDSSNESLVAESEVVSSPQDNAFAPQPTGESMVSKDREAQETETASRFDGPMTPRDHLQTVPMGNDMNDQSGGMRSEAAEVTGELDPEGEEAQPARPSMVDEPLTAEEQADFGAMMEEWEAELEEREAALEEREARVFFNSDFGSRGYSGGGGGFGDIDQVRRDYNHFIRDNSGANQRAWWYD